jgi:coenzyme F420-reducing hydrogenase gamma subunit
MSEEQPKIAVQKFASCDGCQLSLLDCEDELLDVAGEIEIAYFPEASRDMHPGPYDITFIEGSITTPHDAARIKDIREESDLVVTIGACATAGGIQALRNFTEVEEYSQYVYPKPEYIDTLQKSTPIKEHIDVDFELQGCPINKYQFVEVINALLNGRDPNISEYSVCFECKRKGTVCIMVAKGIPCLGPVTHAGCGAICPAYDRGCYGCFGPMESPNPDQLSERFKEMGVDDRDIYRVFHTFNANSEGFKEAGGKNEQ